MRGVRGHDAHERGVKAYSGVATAPLTDEMEMLVNEMSCRRPPSMDSSEIPALRPAEPSTCMAEVDGGEYGTANGAGGWTGGGLMTGSKGEMKGRGKRKERKEKRKEKGREGKKG